jgi:signal transduction histidine kinase
MLTDTGVGISEDAKGQIFEPFYTTKELGKGTGLGLYICYRIAMKYQGRIDVESTQGQAVALQ